MVVLMGSLAGPAQAAQCQLSTPAWQQMHMSTIALLHDSGKTIELRVRIADESSERAAGYQHICPEIIDLSAILFVYEKPQIGYFHMNNVHAQLDMGFSMRQASCCNSRRWSRSEMVMKQIVFIQATAIFNMHLKYAQDFLLNTALPLEL